MKTSSRACNLAPSIMAAMMSLVLMLPLSCAAQDLNPVGKRHALKVGGVSLDLELALDDASRALGLMHRTAMEDRQGMLFVFDRDQNLHFWMKNTLIPLSVAYIASDGTIKEIHDMSPQSLMSVNSVYLVRYALELNQGAFGRLGIQVGDKLEIKDWYKL